MAIQRYRHADLAGCRPFVANDIYEFTYTAKDPTVNGVGFAAVRDWNAFLRYATADDNGVANPLAGDVQRIYTDTLSQPARLINDFVSLGFNQGENGKKVFDGNLQWIGAGDGVNMKPLVAARTHQPNRQELRFLEGLFPWANVTSTDPISGRPPAATTAAPPPTPVRSRWKSIPPTSTG